MTVKTDDNINKSVKKNFTISAQDINDEKKTNQNGRRSALATLSVNVKPNELQKFIFFLFIVVYVDELTLLYIFIRRSWVFLVPKSKLKTKKRV
jgi:hypothetical protein